MEECVSFGDAAVEAEVPLLLFLELDLLKAFGREMESEEPREECVSFGGRLGEALVFCCWLSRGICNEFIGVDSSDCWILVPGHGGHLIFVR